MKGNAYVLLARYILPQEFEDHFELNDVSEEKVGAEMLLHLYLEEKDEAPEGREDLIPNGHSQVYGHRTGHGVCDKCDKFLIESVISVIAQYRGDARAFAVEVCAIQGHARGDVGLGCCVRLEDGANFVIFALHGHCGYGVSCARVKAVTHLHFVVLFAASDCIDGYCGV